MSVSSTSERLSRRQALLLLLLGVALPAQVLLQPATAWADDDGDGGDGDGGDGDGDGGDGGDGGDDGGDGGDDGGGDDDDGQEGGDGDDDDDDDSGGVENGDHDYAWRARRRGELRSLRDILQRARRRYGGRVLDVRLKRKKGRAWYEIRILDRRDHVRTLRVPAAMKRQNFNIRRR